MWFFIGGIVFLVLSKLDSILNALKEKDPLIQKEKMEKQKMEMEEKQQLIENLRANIGKVCTIKSTDLVFVVEKLELTARILDVDGEWIHLEYNKNGFRKKETTYQLLYNVARIDSFSVEVENEIFG